VHAWLQQIGSIITGSTWTAATTTRTILHISFLKGRTAPSRNPRMHPNQRAQSIVSCKVFIIREKPRF
jgi:hypothetical protein